MRSALLWVVLGCLPLVAACGGGGGASAGVINEGSGSLVAGFVPDQPSPGSETASMDQGSRTGDLVTVRVNVTGTSGVYGAAFDITYDPAMATYVSWSAGSLLEDGGHAPTYQVGNEQSGRLVVGASRNGSVAAVNVQGTRTLIQLTFRLRAAGSTPLVFGSPELFDAQAPPQPIPGVQWFGGALSAQ